MPESEPYPHKIYNISLFGETLTFFTLSLRHYEAILGNDLHRVQNDANLRLFLNDQQIGSLRVGYEVERVKEAASRFQAMIEADPAPFATHHLSLTYEYLKLMKSAAGVKCAPSTGVILAVTKGEISATAEPTIAAQIERG